VEYYKKEVHENETKLATMRDQQLDPYDIKKFEEVLGESYMMVPDSEGRLKKSLEDLQQLVSAVASSSSSSEWGKAARELLQNHTSKDGSNNNKNNNNNDADQVEETNVDDLKDDEAF